MVEWVRKNGKWYQCKEEGGWVRKNGKWHWEKGPGEFVKQQDTGMYIWVPKTATPFSRRSPVSGPRIRP